MIFLLAKLLAAANSDVRWPFWFYGIKDRVLKRFGRRVAWDRQHIVKECWSCTNGRFCGYDNGYAWVPMPEQPCSRCGGTGVYDEFWVLLEVWHLGGYEFHRPVQQIRKGEFFTVPPNGRTSIWIDFRKKIEGRIRHSPHPCANRAFWVLAVIFTPGQVVTWIWGRVRERFRHCWLKLSRWYRRWRLRDEDIPF